MSQLLKYRLYTHDPVLSAIAFHEKAGGSQVVSLSFLFVTRFFSAELPTVATLPSALFDERVFSLGASWAFSFQSVLPPDYRPLLHRKMEVGPGDCRSHRNSAFGLCASYRFNYAAAGSMA